MPESTTPRHDSSLCVLASGSRGNCSALVVERSSGDRRTERRVVLFDLGLSPRRTGRLLDAAGVGLDEVSCAVLTHLDRDHCHSGWLTLRRSGFPVFVHERHLGRARRSGLLHARSDRFGEDGFEPFEAVRIHPMLVAHDSLGVAVFLVELPCGGRLGYATDVGRPTPEIAAHLAGVDMLALESNYCPELQERSARPVWLKRRITGGAGHLSNQQSSELVRAIAPRRRVVLLHLSEDCNRPEAVMDAHKHDRLEITVSSQREPTGWIPIEPDPNGAGWPAVRLPKPRQQELFGAA